MTEDEKLHVARRHVASIKGFYIHLTVYVLVMALLIAVNAADLPGWWAQWPLLGWGIGVAGHAFAVFGSRPAAVENWERGKVIEMKRRLDEAETKSATPGPTSPPPGSQAP